MTAREGALRSGEDPVTFRAKDRSMGIQRNERPSAWRRVRFWAVILATGAVALAGCRQPHAIASIPPSPAGAAPALSASVQTQIDAVLNKMKTAYDAVTDYQAEVEVTFFAADGYTKSDKVLFTFKKPDRTRIEFVSPHPGMVLVYPDPDGKVVMRPNGLLSVFTFHLELDDPLLATPSGQRFNQTDLGLLISNMGHSLGDQRRGLVSISEDATCIKIQVLAADHFREGVVTRYEFLVNKDLGLPTEVDAFTPEGAREGQIVFRGLRTNIEVPDSLFQ